MDDIRIRADMLLEEAGEAIDGQKNGLYDRGDLMKMISTFMSLVEELLDESRRERLEMTGRLRRSPFRFVGTSEPYADSPSV